MDFLNPGQIRLVVILLYLASLLFLGFFASRLFRGTKQDYLLASHSIGPFLLLMSIFGTTMTAFALVGSSGEAYKEGIGVYGMLASSSGIIHSLCFFVIGVKIYGFGRKYGYSTQVEFFRDRLESDFVGLLLFPILVALVIPYLLIGIGAGGGVIQAMTAGAFPELFEHPVKALDGGVPKWLGSLLVCGVVLIYVFFGGMRGTTWANAFQTLVFMALGLVTFLVLANRIGGGDTLLESLQNASAKVSARYTTRSEMSATKFFTYLLIPLSVGMFPHLFQHWLTAKSAASFKLPVVMHPLFIMIVWVPCVLIGIWATTQNIPPSIEPNKILAFLVNKETSQMAGGAVLAGLLAAGILAAIMSSLDSQFLCLGSMFTNDIVTHYLGKERFSDTSQIWIARAFIVVIVAITYALAMQDYRSVFTLGVWCFSGFASLFPLVFAALYWRRLTAAGAVSGILAAAGSWFYLFRDSGYGANGDYGIKLPIEGNHEIMPVVAIILCTIIAMVATSLLTKPPSEATVRKFFPDVV